MVYFAGDTAFGDHFAAIRERFGAPRWRCCRSEHTSRAGSCRPVHMGPEDAARAHHILGAQTSIAIHHGTFQLGDEGLDTPRSGSASAPRAIRFWCWTMASR